MTMTLTYDSALSRVRVDVNGMGAATTAHIERSTDQIRWLTVRGAAAAPVTGSALTLPVDDYEFSPNVVNYYRASYLATSQSSSITPTITAAWLQSVSRPFLNHSYPRLLPASEIRTPARRAEFVVSGRRYPVIVSDVPGGRNMSIQVVTEAVQDGEFLEALLATGDIVYVKTPPNHSVRSMYASVGDVAETPVIGSTVFRQWTISLTQTDAPRPSVVGYTSTCATVVATYATCADVVVAHATCLSVMNLIGTPSEIITS